jgi:predicted HAD superfamily phosphohydrolase YqeG
MKNKPDIEKLVKNIRENGVKVFIVANKNSENLTQLDFRIMIENNLDRMKNKSIQCQNFAEIVESLKDIIEFKEEK